MAEKGDESRWIDRARKELFKSVRDGVVYVSYFSGKVNNVLDAILDGSYYRYIQDEKRKYADDGDYVDIVIGFKEQKGVICVKCIVYNELQDFSNIRIDLLNDGYSCYNIRDFRNILERKYNNPIDKLTFVLNGELIEF